MRIFVYVCMFVMPLNPQGWGREMFLLVRLSGIVVSVLLKREDLSDSAMK